MARPPGRPVRPAAGPPPLHGRVAEAGRLAGVGQGTPGPDRVEDRRSLDGVEEKCRAAALPARLRFAGAFTLGSHPPIRPDAAGRGPGRGIGLYDRRAFLPAARRALARLALIFSV